MTDGLAYYDECLKWHLSVGLTAEQVHQIGLDEVDRIVLLMEQVITLCPIINNNGYTFSQAF